MKKYLLSLALIATGASLFAQQRNFIHINPEHKAHLDKMQKLIQSNQPNIKNKPTGIQQRVIAQAFYEEGILESDSTSYVYSGTRGSKYQFDNFDLSYPTEFSNSYAPIFIYPNENSFPSNMQADVIKNYEGNTIYDQSNAYYRPDGKMDSFIYSSAPNDIWKTTNYFNAAGTLTEYTMESTAGDFEQVKHLYDNLNSKVLSDTIFTNYGGSTIEMQQYNYYTYNANNKLDTIFSKFLMSGSESFLAITYDNNGKYKTLKDYNVTPLGAELFSVDSFTYEPGNDLYSNWNSRYIFAGFMDFEMNTQMIFNANNFPDTIVIKNIDNQSSTEEVNKIAFIYNSFNNPERLHAYSDDQFMGHANFYYEEYDDGETSIGKISDQSFEIYPNPVDNHIIIQNKDLSTTSKWSVSLTDVLGRKVFAHELLLNAGQNMIQLPELPTGMYTLNLENAREGKVSRKVMKK